MDEEDAQARQLRDAAMQRVRVGISGLAAVFLLTLLAASVFSFLGTDDPHATRLANGVVVANAVTNGQDAPKEPLAELGIAPGGSTPKAPSAGQPHPAPAAPASHP